MRDIYLLVPKGTKVYYAGDDHDLADMAMAPYSKEVQATMEVLNIDLHETDD